MNKRFNVALFILPVMMGFIAPTFHKAAYAQTNGIIEATQEPGVDIGAKINAAYSALPVKGGRIHVSSSSSCYRFTTPILLSTAGKVAILEGDGTGTCLNYTGKKGVALTINWSAGHYPGTVRNIKFVGPGSATRSVGIQVGGVVEAAGATAVDLGTLEGLFVSTFGTGIQVADQSFCNTIDHVSIIGNGVGVLANLSEQVRINNSTIAQNRIGLEMVPGYVNEITLYADAFDDNIVTAIAGSGALHDYSSHFENVGGGTSRYLSLIGGAYYEYSGNFLDDRTKCSPAQDEMVSIAGSGQIYFYIDHPFVYSSGCTVKSFASISNSFGGGGEITINNQSAMAIQRDYTITSSAVFRIIDASQIGDSASTVTASWGQFQLSDPFPSDNPRYVLHSNDGDTSDRIFDLSGRGPSALMRFYKQAKGTDSTQNFAMWDSNGDMTNYGALKLGPLTSDPSAPGNGEIWYSESGNVFRCYENNTLASPCFNQTYSAVLVTTKALSDRIKIIGMTNTGHCSLTATNSSAAANMTATYVGDKSQDYITVFHTPISGMTYDVLCTPD